MSLTGNKGEWSEIYAFLYLAGTGRLYAADDKMRRMSGIFFPVLKIFRNETPSKFCEYRLPSDGCVQIYVNGQMVKALYQIDFKNEADFLLNKIKNGRNSFAVSQTESFLRNIECSRLTAPARDKTDIMLQIHDIGTGFSPVCGFSIKSELGDPPTLINASRATNFIFSLPGMSYDLMNNINSCSTPKKIRERIDIIKDNRIPLVFDKVSSDIFSKNLRMIDTRFEEILATALQYYYFGEGVSCAEIVRKLEEKDPLSFNREGIYSYKFKQFLYAAALGMTPAKQWNGLADANGGYIIVASDGNVLAYYLYNKNAFEDYLLNNTKFERASTKRHNYAMVYNERDKFFFNLNLQIRFIR